MRRLCDQTGQQLGHGIRETLEVILKAKRRWDDFIQKYTS